MKSTSSSFFPFFFPLLFILREKKCLTADKATVLAMRAITEEDGQRKKRNEEKKKYWIGRKEKKLRFAIKAQTDNNDV